MQVGESAGPECKAALQETTRLVDEQLQSDSHSVKALFGAQTVIPRVFYDPYGGAVLHLSVTIGSNFM
jgi:hypothetical protein